MPSQHAIPFRGQQKLRWGPLPAVLAALCLVVEGGCGRSAPTAPAPARVEGRLPALAAATGWWPAGASGWRWHCGQRQGTALLLVSRTRWSWRLQPAPPPGAALRLEPRQPERWLACAIPAGAAAGCWLPLPRLPLRDAPDADLVAFLRRLTTPRFAGRVVHWPARPVPVISPPAHTGGVDLKAALAAAVARWNAGEDRPWFALADSAAWGVRLVHLAGRRISPPAWAQITRLDDEGRPRRVHLVVGDNYDSPVDSIYAVRALAHELGHALFLWGHSPARRHLLWGRGPPLVEGPHADERKAAQLWHGLPEGLDLGRYGPVIPR